MTSNSQLVFLYSEVMGYTSALLDAVVRLTEAQVTVFYWDTRRLSQFNPEALTNAVSFLPRSRYDEDSICNFLHSIKPQLIYCAGWMDAGYLGAIRRYRRSRYATRIIVGLDTHFEYNFRKLGGVAAFRVRYRRLFDGAWVAGPDQYTYARLLGFAPRSIRLNLYSADTGQFRASAAPAPQRRMIFVGRLAQEKNVERLLQAFTAFTAVQHQEHEWQLHIFGSGPLEDSLRSLTVPNVRFFGFTEPDSLAQEFAKGGVFVLPSLKEPWGVAVHEAASAGLPLLISSASGASRRLLIDGYNGYGFEPGSVDSLFLGMKRINSLSHAELHLFGKRSRTLAGSLSPEIAAASFLSFSALYE